MDFNLERPSQRGRKRKGSKAETLSALIKKPEVSRITMIIPADIHRELKQLSLDKNVNIKELGAEALRNYLDSEKARKLKKLREEEKEKEGFL